MNWSIDKKNSLLRLYLYFNSHIHVSQQQATARHLMLMGNFNLSRIKNLQQNVISERKNMDAREHGHETLANFTLKTQI